MAASTNSARIENPIPDLLGVLRRQGRLPDRAKRSVERIASLPPGRHEPELLAEGIVTEEDIAQAVARDTDVPFRAINALELNPDIATGALPAPFARRHTICAISREGNTLTVAMANPYERGAVADLERYLGVRVEVVVATRSDINSINGSLYNLRTSLRAAETELNDERAGSDEPALGTQEFLSESEAAGDLEPTTRPVVAALDSILHQAFEHRASDIHLEPKRDRAVVRFRIDGVLRTMHTFPRIVYQAVVSRLKMLSGLDIAEKRRPQDGRFKRIEPNNEIEMRVSILPTVFGEKAVLRVFDPSALVSSLDQLRLAGDETRRLRDMLNRREGLLLVTGPTGSGKTTTLYSVLRTVATPEVNVITIEDPVELIHPPLSQVQVNSRIGLGFAEAIRSVLRQDPDILMIGEIRDPTTAEMAVQAALTGHLVLSTLHTNDAPASVTRLADLGVPRFLIGTTLVGVIAQRLLRTICGRCARPGALSEAAAASVAAPTLTGRRIRVGRGCPRCRESGYRGRRAVFEIVNIDAGASALILNGANSEEIARYARSVGCRSLRQSALRALLAGETTLTEVVRVTGAGPDPGFGDADCVAAALSRDESVAERAAGEEQEGGNPVEDADDVDHGEGPAADGHPGEPSRRVEGNGADPGDRVDQDDRDQVEEQVDHRELEPPVRVRSGHRESGEKGGDRGADVRSERDREGVVEQEEAGPGERHEHGSGDRAGLDQDRGEGPDAHREEDGSPEDPVDRLLRPTGRDGAEGPDQKPERENQEAGRDHEQDRGGPLIGAGEAGRQPFQDPGDHTDDRLEGALVIEAGAGEPGEEVGDRARGPEQESGGDLDREKDHDRQQVEHVVTGGNGEGPTKLVPVTQVSEGGEGVRDGRSDVGAHDHGDGARERERRLGGGDERDDERTGDRRTLDQGGCEHPDEKPDNRVLGRLEEPVEQPGPEPLEAVGKPVDRAEEEDEEGEESDESGEEREPGIPSRVRAATQDFTPTGRGSTPIPPDASTTPPVYVFVMDD